MDCDKEFSSKLDFVYGWLLPGIEDWIIEESKRTGRKQIEIVGASIDLFFWELTWPEREERMLKLNDYDHDWPPAENGGVIARLENAALLYAMQRKSQ